MKLDFVEMAGFRGFREKTRFDFPAGFAVLTGRNGVGKSTILDAIDFAVTGTINKFAFKSAKGGGLDEVIVGRPVHQHLERLRQHFNASLAGTWTPTARCPRRDGCSLSRRFG